jgi:hypothetical protein
MLIYIPVTNLQDHAKLVQLELSAQGILAATQQVDKHVQLW